MRIIMLMATLGLAVAAAPNGAHAQDHTLSWSGAYFGLGAAQGRLNTWQHSPAQYTAPAYHKADYAGSHRYGFVQAGVRRQFGNTVLGLRLRHEKTGSDGDQFQRVDEVVSSNAVSLTTLSATLGYVVQPQMLLYATVGAVHGRFSYGSVDEEWDLVHGDLAASRRGLSLGIGTEYRLSDRMSVFAEYSHTQFQKRSATFDYGPGVYPANWTYDYKHKLGTLQVGMNFQF